MCQQRLQVRSRGLPCAKICDQVGESLARHEGLVASSIATAGLAIIATPIAAAAVSAIFLFMEAPSVAPVPACP